MISRWENYRRRKMASSPIGKQAPRELSNIIFEKPAFIQNIETILETAMGKNLKANQLIHLKNGQLRILDLVEFVKFHRKQNFCTSVEK